MADGRAVTRFMTLAMVAAVADITDLGARRALREVDPEKIAPTDMLRRVLASIEAGELQLSHVMVISATSTPDFQTTIQVDHAGVFDRFGQCGALMEALRIMQNA